MTILSISFPFRQGAAEFPQTAIDDDAIKSNIIQIILTPLGSRLMRPTFGSNVLNYVFENDSVGTRISLEREVRTALARWEPRISVSAVQVESGSDISEPGQVLVTIFYTVVSSNLSTSITVGVA